MNPRHLTSTLAAAVALAAAQQACAAGMREMSMRVPLMEKAPVVDGIVDAAEWQGASGSFGFVRYRSSGDTIGKKGLTLPYMLDCICLTTRNGRGRLRGTLRLNSRHFEADERGWIGRGQISSNPCKMGVSWGLSPK